MKILRLIFIFSILLLFDLLPTKAANVYAFVWESTSIEVTEGSSIYDYLQIPKVSIYCNDTLLNSDVSYTYNDFDVVVIDTSKEGNNSVAYTASYNGIEDYCTVVFRVVLNKDETPPVITKLSDIVIDVKDDLVYDSFFSFSDDTTLPSDLIVKYSNTVNNNIVSKYTLTVSCIDESSNVTKLDCDVSVVDRVAPVIKQTQEVLLNYGEVFNPFNYFEITDNYDNNFDLDISWSDLNFTTLGNHQAYLEVRDRSLNTIKQIFNVTILDNVFPVVSLNSDSIDISLNNQLPTKDFYLSLITYSDNFCKDCSVSVDYSSVVNYLGTYRVIYTISDGFNETKKELFVRVVSSSKPNIICNDIDILVGEEIDYSKYIVIYDDIDQQILNYYVDDSKVDTSKPGTYEVYISVNNSMGISSEKTILVKVTEESKNPPILLIVIICGIIYFVIKKKKS